jgi:transposase
LSVEQQNTTQTDALEPLAPEQWRLPRVDDRHIVNANFRVLRKGIPWRDLPKEYGPQTTACNRVNRWSISGGRQSMFECYATKSRDPLATIDITAVKAHRAAGGAKGGK